MHIHFTNSLAHPYTLNRLYIANRWATIFTQIKKKVWQKLNNINFKIKYFDPCKYKIEKKLPKIAQNFTSKQIHESIIYILLYFSYAVGLTKNLIFNKSVWKERETNR